MEGGKEEEGDPYIPEEQQPPSLIRIEVTQSVSWLKEMYEAKLVIYNNANSPRLCFENNTAAISLPGGISLAKTAEPQSKTITMDTIRGGGSGQAIWYLSGDQPGTYQLHASYEGTYMPFGQKIGAEFESNEFEVEAGKGLVLYISPETRGEYAEKYDVGFTLRNESDHDFYNVKTTFGTAASRRYYRITPDTNGALPLMSSGDYISIPILTGPT